MPNFRISVVVSAKMEEAGLDCRAIRKLPTNYYARNLRPRTMRSALFAGFMPGWHKLFVQHRTAVQKANEHIIICRTAAFCATNKTASEKQAIKPFP